MPDEELGEFWKRLLVSRGRPADLRALAEPGVYALFLRAAATLPGVAAGSDGLLYVGKSDRSLAGRSHFTGSSSSSSPRRSLGALLRSELHLRAIPRDGSGSRSALIHYGFAVSGEWRLSQWMLDHLDYAFAVVEQPTKATEARLIAGKTPPLNLTGWRNPQAPWITAQRRLCQLEATRA